MLRTINKVTHFCVVKSITYVRIVLTSDTARLKFYANYLWVTIMLVSADYDENK